MKKEMMEKNNKQRNKRELIVLLIILFVISIPFILLAILLWMPPIKETNLNKYLQTDGNISEFVMFPNLQENKGNILEYYYCNNGLKSGDELVLKVKYQEIDFENEVLRISNCKTVSNIVGTKEVVKDADNILFNSLTFVAVYEPERHNYEYAIVDFGEREIVYVVLYKISIEYINLDSMYLPKAYFDEKIKGFDYKYSVYQLAEYDKWFGEEYHYE